MTTTAIELFPAHPFGTVDAMDVSHDAVAAGDAGRGLVLVDGRLVEEMRENTAQRVLDLLALLGDSPVLRTMVPVP